MAPSDMECPNCGVSNPPGVFACSKCATPIPADCGATVAGDIPFESPPGGQETAFSPTEWARPDAAGASEVSPGPLLPGAVLGGRYEILELLGEGGMGAVYRARDRELDRDVALKVIRPRLANSPGILARFKQEIILARQVTHRNVIRIFDLGMADGIKFITMEFVEGRDLKSLLRERGKYAPEEAADVMLAVAEGLDAAHRENVIHRDLKPQNVMIDAQGRALVMDFGLAHCAGGQGAAQFGAPVGTPDYMSPEQVRSEEIDARSDIFTMGVIFYELLTGKLPFEAPTPLATMLKRVQGPARPPIEIDPSIPKALNRMVVKCLAMDPADRYPSSAELLHELQVWRGVIPRGGLPRVWKWVTASLTVLLVLAGGVAIWQQLSKPPPKQKTVTLLVADFQNTTGEAVFNGTLEPAFSAALEGASFITTFRRDQALRTAAQLQPGTTVLSEPLARLVAVREGISVVLGGSVARKGNDYEVTVRAVDAVKGEPILARAARAGDKQRVLAIVGGLAAQLRKALGDKTPASAQLAASETYSAASLEAAHTYAEAQNLRYDGKGEEAIRAYLRAIELDPNFGSAYAGLAALYANLGQRETATKYYNLAMARVNRMTERERYRTRGGYYLAVMEPDKAIEEFNSLTKQYPSDTMGVSSLAFAYYLRRDMVKALEAGRRAVEIYPKNVPYRNNLALYATYAGDFETAVREGRAALDLNPAYLKAYLAVEMAELARGQPAKSMEMCRRLEKISALGASFAASGMADLALFEGRIAGAVTILQKGVAADLASKNPVAAAKKLSMLADAHLIEGRHAQALAAMERAVALNKESVLFRAARVYVEADREAKAMALAAELGRRFEPLPQAYAKLIEGEVQVKRRHPREAIKLFEESLKFSDTWLGRFYLGRAYLEAEAFTRADSEFDKCLKRRGEATDVFWDEVQTYHYFPPVYYYLGRVREGLKSSGAAESYNAFLALKVEDSQDPLVADTHRRLSRLQ